MSEKSDLPEETFVVPSEIWDKSIHYSKVFRGTTKSVFESTNSKILSRVNILKYLNNYN